MEAIVNGLLTCVLTGEHTWKREVGFCTTAAGVDINQAIIAKARRWRARAMMYAMCPSSRRRPWRRCRVLRSGRATFEGCMVR